LGRHLRPQLVRRPGERHFDRDLHQHRRRRLHRPLPQGRHTRTLRRHYLPLAPPRGRLRMRIATWNINGVKARLGQMTTWLAQQAPDIVCLQEIKTVDEAFPRAEIEALGYQIETHGQKGWNGVAILSKVRFDEVTRGLPGDDTDEQSRLIEGV